ncbi:MAG: zinc metallopeptidase [Bacillota bacterium]
MYWGYGVDAGLLLFVLPAFIFSLYAQARVTATAQQFSRVMASVGKTGAQVAEELLWRAGIRDVRVTRTPGVLSDHYDPRQRVLRLSPAVHDGFSITALGVAAHEVGHAIQHAVGYGPLALRNRLVPVVSFSSQAAIPLFFVGLIVGSGSLMNLGLILFLGAVVFTAITLPVEYNASSRALAELEVGGYLRTEREVRGARAVLNAAALTYVAALAMAVAQLLRMFMLARSRED